MRLVTVKEREGKGFGARLAAIRKSRGMTQGELGEAVGVSYRVIAYYETESTQPPGAMLADLAHTLRVSIDEMLGIKPLKEKTSPKTARLMKRLQRVEELPPTDQKAVLKYLDALIKSRAVTSPTRTREKRRGS